MSNDERVVFRAMNRDQVRPQGEHAMGVTRSHNNVAAEQEQHKRPDTIDVEKNRSESNLLRGAVCS